MDRQAKADLMRETLQALVAGDRDKLQTLVTPDATYHVPGRNILSGDYQGVDGMLFFFHRITQLAGSEYHRDVEDSLVGETHAATLIHVTAHHDARTLDFRLVLVAKIEGGRVADLRGYYADQRDWDMFWSDQMLTGSPVPDFHPPRRPIEP